MLLALWAVLLALWAVLLALCALLLALLLALLRGALAVASRARPRAPRGLAPALFCAVQLVGRLLAGVALLPLPLLSPKQG